MNAPRILVVGLGKLGLPMAAVFSSAGFDVTGTDASPAVLDAVEDGTYPRYEPGLSDLLAAFPLRVVPGIAAAASTADIAFVVVPTPSDDHNRFYAGYVRDAVSHIAAGFASRPPDAPRPVIVVVSTVMPGTCGDLIRATIDAVAPDTDIGLAYHPEFIALGSVITDLRSPSVVYLGADDDASATALWSVLRRVVTEGTPAVRLSLTEAEVAKLAVNVYLSVKIGYANEIAALCHEFGADPTQVLGAVGADDRIGASYFRHGPPPSGPCLPRDLRAWATLLPSPFATAAHDAADAAVTRVAAEMWSADTVGVLGLAYKPGSNIADESFGWRIAERLADDGKTVLVHDPHVTGTPRGCTHTNIAAVRACDAVIVACDHPEYHGITHTDLVRP